MNTREVELLAAESITTLGTKTIDLGLQNPVSRLDIMWRKTNSNRTPIAHPGKIVESIDLVDGSDVLFSMNGQDAQAMEYFTSGKQPGSMINYETGQWSMQIASIPFGRFLWDEMYALDPRRFNNIQLKIKHNIALGGATGTVGDLSVYAHVWDDKVVQPKGFLLTKEQYSFLPVASAWVYVDLPTDFPIRCMMFGANECEQGPEYNINKFKLTENEGKSIVIESAMERYLLVASQNYNMWQEKVLFKTAAAATDLSFYASPHWERTYEGHVEGTAYATAVVSAAGCLYKLQNATAAAIIEGFAMGHAPFGQTFLPFGDLEGVEYWDIQKAASGKLSLLADASCDVDEYVRVFVQQVRDY